MFYRFSRGLLRILFSIYFRLEVLHADRVRSDHAYILCANHQSNWDPPLVGTPLDPQVHYMAKEELFRIPVVKSMITAYGTFPVNRQQVGKQTIQTVLKLLKANKIICIFPEGSRNSQEARRGAATFALKTNTPVIPVAIAGSYKPFSKMKVIYGNPMLFTHLQDLPKEEQVAVATQEIMDAIHKLLREDLQ
jgi:1-acyl-sn-glycerol-3-phosphate acyltransferase